MASCECVTSHAEHGGAASLPLLKTAANVERPGSGAPVSAPGSDTRDRTSYDTQSCSCVAVTGENELSTTTASLPRPVRTFQTHRTDGHGMRTKIVLGRAWALCAQDRPE